MDVQQAHIHVDNVRPDVITRSGSIMPFPMQDGPDAVAEATIRSFYQTVMPDAPRPSGYSGYEPQPEEVAMMANRLATAMGQGLMPEGVVDQKLIAAARMIMSGQPFIIRSAGRAALVRAANAPASISNLVKSNPASSRY